MHLQSSKFVNSTIEFAQCILDTGDGKGALTDSEQWIKILDDIIISQNCNAIPKIVECTYPDLKNKIIDEKYLQKRAILTPKYETVHEINDYMMDHVLAKE